MERLRQRHATELAAVRRVADATDRLAAAGVAADVAIAAAVTVFGGVERTADSVGMTVDAVRAAQGRAPSGAVRAAVAGRRGASGGGRAARGERSAVAERQDERDDSGDGSD
ncbi:hypothetical protein [Dactylosporangium sp. CA-233914]|uniref:hypothetical protein n=1 Tax=Dactylosporangium sp. CA-233914 TaxID=3239934 RepID=UPI003D9459B4